MITVDLGFLRHLRVTPALTPDALATLEEVAPLLVARRPEYTPATAAAIATARELHRRSWMTWNWVEDGARKVPNLTCGTWPTACTARWTLTRPGHPTDHAFVCTRISPHTGRHAAGHGGHIVAVWGDHA